MEIQSSSKDEKRMSQDYLSSSTLEVVLDDRSLSDSGDEFFHNQPRQSSAGTTGNEQTNCRRKKQMPIRDPKSHRLIEKRRRDRMNACLNELLQLTPHILPETQRRIEKTEIIEMAIKHMRYLITTVENKSNNQDSNIDSYRTGYRNALADIYDVIREYSDTEEFLTDMTQLLKDKELGLDNLAVMPDRKRVKYSTISTRSPHSSSSSSSSSLSRKRTMKDNDQLCVISHVEESKPNDIQSTRFDRQTSTQTSESNVKVPIFVLHPSGTHYIPMCIDSSVVSHAFKKASNLSRSTSTTIEQVQCHPVSIPVNFNPISTSSDSFELDIQNINVIGTRHQTSVRPN